MKPLSIRTRLLAAAAGWIAIAWLGGAAVLSFAFSQAVTSRFDLKVGAVLRSVTAALRVEDAGGKDTAVVSVGPIGDPRFQVSGSGWYWQVRTADGTELRSPSLGDFLLTLDLAMDPGQVSFGYDRGPDDVSLRTAQTATELVDGRIALVKVAVDDRDVQEEIDSFETLIHLALGTLGIGLTAAILFQVQLGLHPLRRLARELERFQAGELDELSRNYPSDLANAVEAVNSVIAHNRQVVLRVRQSAGNLAHALKTELALLKSNVDGDAHRGDSAPDIHANIDRIARIVEHHLHRAATAGPVSLAPERVDVARVVTDICAALRRLYRDRDLTVDCHIAAQPQFRGERQDLEELVGNLIENACKHASTRVMVTLSLGGKTMTLRVDDDGPGMTERKAALAVLRGKRLDERSQGSGLGLSIVADLAEMYGGQLALSGSAIGGLLAVLTLPAR